MCEQDEFGEPREGERAAAGVHSHCLTAEVRNHLQTCVVSVELLTALELSREASRCAERLERAVRLLVDGLMRRAPGQMVDSRRLFR
jgi:hypothetical protein